MTRVRIAAMVVMALGLLLAGGSVAAGVGLGVPMYKQEKSLWCWAASSKMMIAYVAKQYPAQCDVVKKGLNKSKCDDLTGVFYGDIDRALSAYGVNPGTAYNSVPTEAKLRENLNASKPVMIRYGYKSTLLKKVGHVVVIKGYEWNASAGAYRYSWQDPGSGTTVTGTFGYLKNNSTWAWTHSRFNMTKK